MYYLGIDHHKRYSQVAVVDEKRRCSNSLTKTDNPSNISLEVKPKLKLKRKRKLIP